MKRNKKPRTHARQWFTASIFVDGDRATLDPKRGCQRDVIDADGNKVSSTHEPQQTLRANLGDHLILCGATVEETVDAEVVGVAAEQWRERLHVRISYGQIKSTTVHVTKGRRAA